MIRIYSDGGARGNPGPAASAFLIYDGEKLLHSDSKYLGETTNNVAEYTGVIIALTWLVENKNINLNNEIIFNMDSELVVKQLMGLYKIKDKKLIELAHDVKVIEKQNNLKIKFQHIPRKDNSLADKLVNEKLDLSSRL